MLLFRVMLLMNYVLHARLPEKQRKNKATPSGKAMEKSLYTTKWSSHLAGQIEEKLILGLLKHF